mgnify:CR=1 FL=1
MIGRLQFAGDGLCNSVRPITFKSGGFCFPSTPTDPRYVAAAPGMQPLLAEVDEFTTMDTCCNSPDPFSTKASLDVAWTPKLNAYLAQYGLVAQLHAFWTYNGQSSAPMMHMLLYALDDAAAASEMQRMEEASKKAASKSGSKKAPPQQTMS